MRRCSVYDGDATKMGNAMKIEIHSYELTKFRCIIMLTEHFVRLPLPVQGQTNGTPWIDAIGRSPEEALEKAQLALGKSLMQCIAAGNDKLVEKI